jgi:mannan endo-1,4-beta-mannosidase
MASAEGGDQDFTVFPATQPSQGKYNKELLEGLDFFLNELRKRNMDAVLYLTNNWEWSGGMSKYLEWNGYTYSKSKYRKLYLGRIYELYFTISKM